MAFDFEVDFVEVDFRARAEDSACDEHGARIDAATAPQKNLQIDRRANPELCQRLREPLGREAVTDSSLLAMFFRKTSSAFATRLRYKASCRRGFIGLSRKKIHRPRLSFRAWTDGESRMDYVRSQVVVWAPVK